MKQDRQARKVKSDLRKTGVRPSKQRGQNFLIDESVLASIVSFADPKKGEKIVEIGAGMGALTEYLPPEADLTLIEIEPEFSELLREKFPRAEIINQDVRRVDFSRIGKELLVFGNLPYVYSTDIVFTLVEQRAAIKRAVLLLQQEFGKRLAAPPGGRDYGVLTVSVQLYADVRLGPIVSGDSFLPSTKVSSQVVELKFLDKPRYPIPDGRFFHQVVQAAFSQRRKKLSNSLMARFGKENAQRALDQAEIDGSRRAETLSIVEFVKLMEALK